MYKVIPANRNSKKDTILTQRLLFYNSMIRSVLHYVSSIWTSCDKENLGRVLKLQKPPPG